MSAEPLNAEEHLHRFGLESFRPGQRDVIDAVLRGEDCLCIMPTGGGKSLCYQLPSVAREGTTLVVSPLIALMKDQVDSLNRLGINAAFVNSALSSTEQEERLMRFIVGEYDMLYVAPERFRSQRFRDAIRKTKIQLLAIDEAHCISEWGHDFRHDYARIGEFREQIGNPQTIALTATATTDVRNDITKQLSLQDPKITVSGFARDNLYYKVENVRGKQAKIQALLDFLKRTPGCGIIYASTRSACEEIRDTLLDEGDRKVVAYHGGLMADDRRNLQEVFMSGKAEIVVATNAFGMGIDKPDVRFVVHFNIPGSLEAYYQEAGRAGRDGLPSICYLLFSQNDRFVQEFFIDSAHPPKESIKKVYNYLCRHPSDPIELTQQELKEALDLSIGPDGVGTCERLLEKANVLERLDSNRNLAAVRIESDAPNLAELLPAQAKTQRRVALAVGNIVTTHRFERFYFHPRDVATLSGEDMTTVNRALRELNRNDWFDYVPPFRGRAVHMLRKDVPFDKLEIDYTRLEERRKSNYAKLDRIIRFASTRRCRQRDILRYFGEATSEKCGHCDNCGAEPGQLPPTKPSSSKSESHEEEFEVSPAMLHVTRIVLSGVARSQGRFGKTIVCGMLCGSQSAKVKKWRLDQLSTFGLLERFKQTEVSDIIDALISLSLIKMVEVDKFRPTVHNTDLGNDVMMARQDMVEPLELERSLLSKIERCFKHVQPPKAKPQPVAKKPADKLSEAKTSEAQEKRGGDSAPDTDDSNPVAKPSDESAKEQRNESSSIPNDHGATVERTSHVRSQVSTESPEVRPTFFWTWLLLHDGYSLDECIAIRQIGLNEVVDHLTRAAESQHPIDMEWLLDADAQKWLRENDTSHQNEEENGISVRPLVESMPPAVTPQILELYRRCNGTQKTDGTSNGDGNLSVSGDSETADDVSSLDTEAAGDHGSADTGDTEKSGMTTDSSPSRNTA